MSSGRREACVVVVAHGSGRPEHVKLVESVVNRVRGSLAPAGIGVAVAYLEGPEHGLPGIPEVLREVVEGGCRDVVVALFFLTPGRHVLEDVPREVREVLRRYPGVKYVITECLGTHPLIPEALADRIRSGLESLTSTPKSNPCLS